jgi:hypothetical protein
LSDDAPSTSNRSLRFFVCVVYFSLGLSLVYSLLYSGNFFGLSFSVMSNRGMVEHTVVGSVSSGSIDVGVWGIGLLIALAWSLFSLGSKLVRGRHRLSSIIGLFGVLGGLVVWVGLVFLGFASSVSLSLASCLLFVLCLTFSVDLFGVSRWRLLFRVLFGGLLFVLFFEVASLVLFNLPMVFNLGPESSAVALHWNLVELSFSNLGYPFLPFVYLFFVLLGVFGAVVLVLPWEKIASKLNAEGLIRLKDRLNALFVLQSLGEIGFFGGRVFVYFAVLVGAVVSCLLVVFTVLPWVNSTGILVSVDAPVYYQWIAHMRSVDFNSAMGLAFSNDRALFLVLGYALSFVVSPLWVVQLAPAFLTVAFGVVCFFVLRLLCKFRQVWTFGVLLVPFSFSALGLIYAGFFANMLALILVLVYVLLFFRVLDKWSSFGLLSLLLVSVGVLFAHPWTWFIFALSLLVFLFLEWRSTVREGLSVRFKSMSVVVGVTVGVGFVCDLLRRVLSPVSSTASVLSTAGSSLGLPNFGYVFSGLEKSVDTILGGVYANSWLVILSIVGLLVLLRIKSSASRFFVAWVFVGCVSILFASQSVVFDRVLFLLPWVILSALGLFWGLGLVSRLVSLGRLRFVVIVILGVLIFLVLSNYALRYVFNIIL